MLRSLFTAVLFAATLVAGTPQFDQALELYHRTDYHKSLAVLEKIKDRDAATQNQIGQNHFMLA